MKEMNDDFNQTRIYVALDGNTTDGENIAAPCGLIAKSYFNGIA
jgi:hypothetical protein